MPVENHPIHPRTVQASGARYGCLDHVRSDFYLAPVRVYRFEGRVECDFYTVVQPVENRMSRECRYDMSLRDEKCEGCTHRGTGERYAAFVKENSQ